MKTKRLSWMDIQFLQISKKPVSDVSQYNELFNSLKRKGTSKIYSENSLLYSNYGTGRMIGITLPKNCKIPDPTPLDYLHPDAEYDMFHKYIQYCNIYEKKKSIFKHMLKYKMKEMN